MNQSFINRDPRWVTISYVPRRPQQFWPRQGRPTVPRVGAGVYAIYFDGDLVYIGSGVNLQGRITAHEWFLRHSIDWQTPGRVVIKFRRSRRYGDWAMIELRLLRRLSPRLNKSMRGVA